MAIVTSAIRESIEPDRAWLEFGVASGTTLLELAEDAPIIYGFDSFEGLPEDWLDENGGLQEPKGKFACEMPRLLPFNAYLVIGRFENTLESWLKDHPGPFGLVHIDCDLYSSTKFVLEQLEPYLDQTVIAFDEIRGFPAGIYHEGRAFDEFIDRGKYNTRLLGHQHNAGAVFKLSRR